MKKREKIVNIFFSVLLQIYFLFPWMETKTGRKNQIMYLCYAINEKDRSAAELIFLILLSELVIIQVLSLLSLVFYIRGRRIPFLRRIECGVFGAQFLAVCMVWGSDLGATLPMPLYAIIYLSGFLLVCGIWGLVNVATDEWDEVAANAEKAREKELYLKQERKRRLNFPGKYSVLYYRILWKNLKYRWKAAFFLFFSVFLSEAFIYMGIGLRNIFADSYGEDNGLLGLGLLQVMTEFLLVIFFVSLFLLSIVLLFYRKKRVAYEGIFQVLGIRSRTKAIAWIREALFLFLAAVGLALLTGRGVLYVICRRIEQVLPNLGSLKTPGMSAYIWAVVVIGIIYLFAFGVSRELHMEWQSADTRNLEVKGEGRPGKRIRIGCIVGGIVAAGAFLGYSDRRFAENIIILGIFYLGLFLIVYNLWAGIQKWRTRDPDKYLSLLVEQHVVKYRYQTNVRYFTLMMIVHVSVLFFFSVKVFSNLISTDVDTLYPYDYVLLANSQDTLYIKQLEEECHADIYTLPMMRVTTIDNTEELEQPFQMIWLQGQNIGISESTYQTLKRLRGEDPEVLDLDTEGKRIYVVYQQDQGTKAKPIDWYQLMKNPNIHIGQPLFAYNTMDRQSYFPERKIVGSERTSLIGSFKQGKYENLIVFSDEYFEQVKDSWKTTDTLTGDAVTTEDVVLGENIHEWPTELVLVKVEENYRGVADEIVEQFRGNHAYDESFDSFVKSAYAKEEAGNRRQMERTMEMTVNVCILVILTSISTLLLHMKVQMDLPELKERYHFMKCFGMNKKQRVSLEKKEISRFVRLPLAFSFGISSVFTLIVFFLRDFQKVDVQSYFLYGGMFWLFYTMIQILNLKWLEHIVVRHVEEGRNL